MKFGKHLKAAGVEGWEYLDYKQLKQLLKRLQSGVGSKEAGEKQFMCVHRLQQLLGVETKTDRVRFGAGRS